MIFRLWPVGLVMALLAFMLAGAAVYAQLGDTQTASGVINAASVEEPTPTPTPTPTPVAVGGIVALVTDADTPTDASGPTSARDHAVRIAVLVAGAVVTLAAGAWYARRRRLR